MAALSDAPMHALRAAMHNLEHSGSRRGPALFAASLLLVPLAVGCIPALPVNIGREPPVEWTYAGELAGAQVLLDPVIPDAVWIDAPRAEPPGAVGGYLSLEPADARTLVLMLPGATTFYPSGVRDKVRDYHADFSGVLRMAGFRTWTLGLRECGAAYGQGDLDDVLAALDWLGIGGAAAIGIEQIVVVGYSSGATVAIRVALERELAAVVAISGLARGDQFRRDWGFFRFLADLYARNEAFCQLGATLDYYGGPDSPTWAELDSVARVEELRSPLLLIHGRRDRVYEVANAESMEAACADARTRGVPLPPCEAVYLPNAGHIGLLVLEHVQGATLAFLSQFAP